MTDLTKSNPNHDFVFPSSVSEFNVPVQTFLSHQRRTQPTLKYGYIACGALVIHDSPEPRILLIQRSASDSMPNLWEIPGGGCDDEDPTILRSVARELREEAGLIAASVGPRVGDDHLFQTRSGKAVCKFNFQVKTKKDEEGMDKVKLEPEEHQNYVWATEEEVKAHKSGDIELRITTKEQEAVILEAFDKVKTMKADPETVM